jgi:hypothetical protein
MVICMHRKTIILCLFAAAVLLVPQNAGSLDAPNITFIPSKISVNSSFIVIADPNAGDDDSILVNWVAGGVSYGSFPKVYGKWMCYFSNTDSSATCGPTPFTEPIPYRFDVSSMNQHGETSNQSEGEHTIDIGNLRLSILITKAGNDISMEVYPSDLVEGVTYSVYSSTGDPMSGMSGDLEKVEVPYVGTISLSNGEYYIAFEADASSGGFGGSLTRVFVGPGSTNGGGDYQLDVDPVVWNPIVSSGGSRTKSNNQITNTGTSAITGLSADVPPEFRRYLDVDLLESSLNVSESMYYTLTLTDIYSSMDINTVVDILSGTSKVGEIVLDLKVSVINDTGASLTCEAKSDGTLCIGGICCDSICREKSNCCSNLDCGQDEECINYLCRQTSTDECSGQSDGYTCTGGICCSERCRFGGECCSAFDCGVDEECSSYNCVPITGDECEGAADGDTCAGGVCFNDECVECYLTSHCQAGETCNAESNTCGTGPPAPEGDYTLIIIAVVVLAAAVGAFLYLKKFRKPKSPEDEEYKEGEEGGFADEEFY